MNTLDFNNITNREVDSYNRLSQYEQNIRRLQSDKIDGESPDNREKRREYIKSSKEFKLYKEQIFKLIDKYTKVLSSGSAENIANINKEIEIRLLDIEKVNEELQEDINKLIAL